MNEQELKAAIAQVIKTAGQDPVGKSAFAELIVRTANMNHLSLDVLRSFMPVTQLQPGDELAVRVRKGRYPVRAMVPGSMHLADQVYVQDKVVRAFDRLIAGATCNVWELNNNEMSTAAKMRTDIRADLIDSLVARVFNLLTTVWNTTDTPSNYTDASSTGITATVLDDMIEEILDRAGSVRAIVGTRRALFPVYEFSTSVPVTVVAGQSGTAIPTDRFAEFYNNNRITSYKGIPLIELGQVYTNALPNVREKLIRSDVTLVVGEDAGQIALMGGFEYQDYTDMRKQPAEYVIHGWQAYSLIVDQIDRIGVIKGNT